MVSPDERNSEFWHIFNQNSPQKIISVSSMMQFKKKKKEISRKFPQQWNCNFKNGSRISCG